MSTGLVGNDRRTIDGSGNNFDPESLRCFATLTILDNYLNILRADLPGERGSIELGQ